MGSALRSSLEEDGTEMAECVRARAIVEARGPLHSEQMGVKWAVPVGGGRRGRRLQNAPNGQRWTTCAPGLTGLIPQWGGGGGLSHTRFRWFQSCVS